ncbi:replication-associated recombination protein A [Estrella lausannensis]|uniref:Replication-associated recombination protein A n=1 Tax=Estrella lausannensis TaxID=483423 RepID=A0A0H5DS67_9BACT|nr:replication-associated recombination protein A [Estrella lausannensis]CRX39123.1 Replication-associated recombination protein A [Estrella lausannensis]
MDLKNHTPLAERMRPKELAGVIGQDHLTGPEGSLSLSIKKNHPFSMILWGPPGSGKTTLARLYAKSFDLPLIQLSAVTSGLQDLKKNIQEFTATPLFGKSRFLFIDEIHRWNKSQQDFLLPFIERGDFFLIGATTENPSLTVNSALLSRVRVFTLNPLGHEHLSSLVGSYEERYGPLHLDQEARESIVAMAQGDGRYLFNLVDGVQALGKDKPLSKEELSLFLQKRAPLYDKAGEGHYGLISALHKSVRGSDPDAALYWLARMLEGGEDPLFLSRRIIRMATEDIGLADPQALAVCLSAKATYEALGSPEGELALAEAIVYLSLAPKSNALYTAYNKARESASKTAHLPPPLHIQNAPTKLMKELGYGKGYLYDHDLEYAFSGQRYFPKEMERESYYSPKEIGFEREMKKRVEWFDRLRTKLNEEGA